MNEPKISMPVRQLCFQASYYGRGGKRPGFTLVEMLVVLALTLLMMVVFAQVFGKSADFVSRQKGIGENDQAARILTTALKTDLQSRTMRSLAPFHPNMPSLALAESQQQGYFYVSENNPADDTDDVLQFTVSLNNNNTGFTATKNPVAGTQLYGRGTFLPGPWQPTTSYATGSSVHPASLATVGFVFKNEGATFTSGAVGSEPNWSSATAPGQTVTDNGGQWTARLSPIDQPDGDDGLIVYDGTGNPTINPAGNNPNNTGASQYAEVCYFLRHGNLYRRVLLIREPYDSSINGVPAANSQPTDADGLPLIPTLYPPYPAGAGSGNFWTDFDYSARIQPFVDPAPWTASQTYTVGATVLPTCPNTPTGFLYTCTTAGTSGATQPTWPTTAGGTVPDGGVIWTASNPPTAPTGVNFLGAGSPESSLNNLPPFGTLPIGRPDNRFGFEQVFSTVGAPPASNGAPREYDSTALFFGRYTDEETSNPNFQFPGNFPTTGLSPMGAATPLTLDPTAFTMSLGNPAAISLAGGARRGEDILLTNVIAFDVKLWDPLYSETLGGATTDVNRNGILDSGPAFADVGHSAPGGCFRGPGSPSTSNALYPAVGGANGSTNVYPQFGPNPNPTGSTATSNNVFDTWFRGFHFDNVCRNYDNADQNVLYAPAPYRPRLGNPWAATHAYNVGDLVDPVNLTNGYTYKCVTAGTSAATPPTGQNDPFSLSDVVGSPILTGTDGTVVWNAQPPLGVQAIQITVKYLDPTQNLLRQVTIVQSLTQ